MSTVGIVLSDDLIFTSRIQAEARAHGLTVLQARTPELLATLAARHEPAGVILDLGHPGLELARLLADLGASSRRPFVVAYGSHVDAAGLHAARQAGCDVVLPRSAFVEQLPGKLAAWLRGADEETPPPAAAPT
jgi:DNA-binding NarL/FixJ family response regulator